MINEKELLQWLEKRIAPIPSPLTFKWYTKKGYAEWVAALAVQQEQKEIIKYIKTMEHGNLDK